MAKKSWVKRSGRGAMRTAKLGTAKMANAAAAMLSLRDNDPCTRQATNAISARAQNQVKPAYPKAL